MPVVVDLLDRDATQRAMDEARSALGFLEILQCCLEIAGDIARHAAHVQIPEGEIRVEPQKGRRMLKKSD